MARGTSTTQRVRRLIALLNQLTEGDRVSVASLAEQVGTSASELAGDLEDLMMCGVAPYDPGDLMPMYIEDGHVVIWGELPALRGPVRLSAAETRALVSALQAVGFDGADPLVARLLAATAGGGFDAEELERTVRALSTAHDSSSFEAVARGIANSEVVSIDYANAGASAVTTRLIEPVALFAERGAWYVTAWCRRAGDWRTFRMDRIRSAALTGEAFVQRVASPIADSAFDAEGLPCATLRFAPGERFSEREWPGASVETTSDDGSVTVSVPFGGTSWIARQVVARLGHVVVIAPDEVRTAVRELAQQELGTD